MKLRLTEIIEFHYVGLEQYVDFGHAYDSDHPSGSGLWRRYGNESEQSAPEPEDEDDQGQKALG